jgi:hypothetical protein
MKVLGKLFLAVLIGVIPPAVALFFTHGCVNISITRNVDRHPIKRPWIIKRRGSTADWHIVDAATEAEALDQADNEPGTFEAIPVEAGLNSSQFYCP